MLVEILVFLLLAGGILFGIATITLIGIMVLELGGESA